MHKHTSFEVGGPAELFFLPSSVSALAAALREAQKLNVPVFPLGSGANILVSDSGIEGLVVSLKQLHHIYISEAGITAESGAEISDVALFAAEAGLSGLEFFFSMPGSVGGSVWMNARCYSVSISDVLLSVDVVTLDGVEKQFNPERAQFDYKSSPFQGTNDIIVSACFGPLRSEEPEKIKRKMAQYKTDREKKGHFIFPSAGSVFKNNRDFGEPTGVLIDRLGLKGMCIGGAKISDLHANIVVNTGRATAEEIRRLVEYMEKAVEDAYGFRLEREIRFIGKW
jgi:UDP-N-acetylmuramate dehydrogenase